MKDISPNSNDETRSAMTFIPIDIIHYNILTKIPAKSLLRFKSVCKDWYNFINSSNFINIHHKRTVESHDLSDFLVVSDATSFFRTSYDDNDDDYTIWSLFYTYFEAPNYTNGIHGKIEAFDQAYYCDIVGSFNGLICLKFSGSGFLLCNPVTREYSRLIKSPPSLASDQFSEATYGFGYDVVSRDYKIINIEKESSRFRQDRMVHVYSTGSNSWKEKEAQKNIILVNRSIYGNMSVVVNNKYHWINTNFNPVMDTRRPLQSILIFDLHTEELGEISYPFRFDTDADGLELTVSHGRLCTLATNLSLSNHLEVSIWVMKEYGIVESWTKLYEIVGEEISARQFHIITHLSRRNSDGDEVLLLRYDNNRNNGELVWYNLENKLITRKAVDSVTRTCGVDNKCLCIASLAPIPGNDPDKRHTAMIDDIKKEVALANLSRV